MRINDNGKYRDVDYNEAVNYQSELTPSEQREQAYNEEHVISWDGDLLTVTEAAQRWQYYAAEGNTAKTDELTVLIATAKAEIRAKYPDNAGGT